MKAIIVCENGPMDRTREIELPLTDGPWVQFTYNCLRTQDGGFAENLPYFDADGFWHTNDDGQTWTDVIIQIVQED